MLSTPWVRVEIIVYGKADNAIPDSNHLTFQTEQWWDQESKPEGILEPQAKSELSPANWDLWSLQLSICYSISDILLRSLFALPASALLQLTW